MDWQWCQPDLHLGIIEREEGGEEEEEGLMLLKVFIPLITQEFFLKKKYLNK